MTKGEIDKYDNEVVCILEDGFKLRFWDMTLTDDEYVKRTNYLQSLESSGLVR